MSTNPFRDCSESSSSESCSEDYSSDSECEERKPKCEKKRKNHCKPKKKKCKKEKKCSDDEYENESHSGEEDHCERKMKSKKSRRKQSEHKKRNLKDDCLEDYSRNYQKMYPDAGEKIGSKFQRSKNSESNDTDNESSDEELNTPSDKRDELINCVLKKFGVDKKVQRRQYPKRDKKGWYKIHYPMYFKLTANDMMKKRDLKFKKSVDPVLILTLRVIDQCSMEDLDDRDLANVAKAVYKKMKRSSSKFVIGNSILHETSHDLPCHPTAKASGLYSTDIADLGLLDSPSTVGNVTDGILVEKKFTGNKVLHGTGNKQCEMVLSAISDYHPEKIKNEITRVDKKKNEYLLKEGSTSHKYLKANWRRYASKGCKLDSEKHKIKKLNAIKIYNGDIIVEDLESEYKNLKKSLHDKLSVTLNPHTASKKWNVMLRDYCNKKRRRRSQMNSHDEKYDVNPLGNQVWNAKVDLTWRIRFPKAC